MVSHLLRAAIDLGLTPADLSTAIARGFANAGG
jgi:hypothetical protein